jgi:hypothetical protein
MSRHYEMFAQNVWERMLACRMSLTWARARTRHAHRNVCGTYAERMRTYAMTPSRGRWRKGRFAKSHHDGHDKDIYIYIYILHVHNCIVQLKSTGRVVQNVWKRMIERKNITTTLGNVCSTYAERMGTYKNLTTLREGCTERMRTYDNDLFCSELL